MGAWQRRAVDEVRRLQGVSLVAIGEEPDRASDVLIDLVGGAPGESIRVAPRVGVWRYGFGDGAHLAGGAPGTMVRLYQTAGPGDVGTVLREGWFGVRTRESPGTADIGSRVAGWVLRLLPIRRVGLCGSQHQAVRGPGRYRSSPRSRGSDLRDQRPDHLAHRSMSSRH